MRKTILFIMTICWWVSLWAPAAFGSDRGPSVVVHFDSANASLDDKEKARLRQLFQKYDVTRAGRVFVLGYTDSQGAKSFNYNLSRKRAQTVRREVISSFGVDATVVMALGKGPENPVADNDQVKGRAQNRRVEIYLANVAKRDAKRVYGPEDPYLPSITELVESADTLVRERQIEAALKKLQEAHALGGDHYSDWHTVMGIAGFYSHAPQARAHLATAVQLDPYNFKAREFLSRLQAQRRFALGTVTPKMGQTPQDAIKITAAVQAHEYLKLFGVEPVAHRELKNQPVQVWECLDKMGQPVVYYFNHAPIYKWAFSKASAPLPADKGQISRQEKARLPLGGAKLKPRESKTATTQHPVPEEKPSAVWESKLFK